MKSPSSAVSLPVYRVIWKERISPRAPRLHPARPWEIVLSFGLIWVLVFRILALHWTTDPQYAYGWMVPLLCLYTGFRRWKIRPAPGPAASLGYWLLAAAAIAFLPAWLVVQPNLDWRIMSWVLTADAVAATLGVLALSGGLRWMGYFAFPVCLIFTAVPWPKPLENPAVNFLMRGVTALTVEALNTVGVAAVDHGNLIELKNGLVGVAEACSGIQSLQAAVMASLVLGELYRLGWRRRVALLLLAAATAIGTNVARTFFLAWQASQSGIAGMEQWHDPAAFAALALCFLILWGAALFASHPQALPKPGVKPAPGYPLDRRVVAAAGAWIVFVFIGTEAWYFDPAKPADTPWDLAPPAYAQPWSIGKGAEEQLQADRTVAGTWQENDGGLWRLVYLVWNPGPMRARILARLHIPEYCLPATGFKLLKDRGGVAVSAQGITLSFHAYTFQDDQGEPLFVYYGNWQDRSPRGLGHGPLPEAVEQAGIQAVLWRERDLGQQVAEFAASGYRSATAADAALTHVIQLALVLHASVPEAKAP